MDPTLWTVGSLPRNTDPTNMSYDYRNTFSEPAGELFQLRGETYLTDRKKVPSGSSAFSLAGVNVFRTEGELFHAADQIKSLKSYLADRPDEDFLVVAWILPGPTYHCVVQLLRRNIPEGQDEAFDLAYSRFKTEGVEYQKSRLKFLCHVPEAPWAVRMAMSSLGGERPVILCRKLDSHHFHGSNYVEVDVSVASSKIATMLNSLFLNAGSRVIVDLGFTIEATTLPELPERMLGAVRWHYCSIDEVACVLGSDGEVVSAHVQEPSLTSNTDLDLSQFNLKEGGGESSDHDTIRD
eukprot:c32138_g1_i1.p1 GENE.c32138_g1_i1~~c32138_g1_i1.p1  ORF type:complete len:303 (+),score=46.25 c32138_g1_i1:27-911(+)